MNKTFLAGPSLHALIMDCPIEISMHLLGSLHPGIDLQRRHEFDEPEIRDALLAVMNELPRDETRKLEDVAQRILGLGRGRGAETLTRVVLPRLSDEDAGAFNGQLDALGRSIWSYLHQPRLFEDAEVLQYAVHFRNYGKIYAAFDAPVATAFAWTEEVEEKLRDRIVDATGLEGPVRLSHLTFVEEGEEADSHVVIIRHGGALSSVAEHRRDGAKGWHYYRPSNEVTLIYSPSRGIVEVCADSPSIRQDAAVAFAEAGLGQDLSKKPLSFKLYNLSRFRESLSLPFFQPEGLKVHTVSVVEVETRPYDPRHRLSLKVTAGDDIDHVIERLFNANSIFRRSPISRLVIGVQYWPRESRRTRALNISLSHPNRCNLRDQADPELRKLGYDLLEHWGVLQALRPMNADDKRALLPLLLDVYDTSAKMMTEWELKDRGFDIESLKAHGFIEAAGRFDGMVIDEDDGGPDLVDLRPGLGEMSEFDDAGGRPTWQPQALVTKFALNHAWIEEIILSQLLPALFVRSVARPVDGLTLLGELRLGGDVACCYLARGLSDVKTVRRIDAYLRGRSGSGIGLILNAGAESPECLGANVVVQLKDSIVRDGARPSLDLEALRVAFVHGKSRARGGMKVELVESKTGTAVLYMPGSDPLLLTGADQITIFRRLVRAHEAGVLAVRTAELMENTGSASPTQAFGDWKSTVSRYVTSPKKGFWQLAF